MTTFFSGAWSVLNRLLRNRVIHIFRSNQKSFHKLLQLFNRLDDALHWEKVNTKKTPAALPLSPDMGISIHGFLSGEFGLGALALYNLEAIKDAGIPFTAHNIKKRGGLCDGPAGQGTPSNSYAVNLICVNADGLRYFMRTKLAESTRGRYNIASLVWELSRFPLQWHKSLQLCDEIWVPSNFCREALAGVTTAPVFKTFSLQIDESGIQADRKKYGLNDDTYAFLFTFDFHSYFQRKNPLALINAFKQAFRPADRVRLILKYMNQAGYPYHVKELKKAIGGYGNIQIVDERLSKTGVYGLMASCDCYASLHRSEGLGLTMAEAMYLDKPVIATGYSGNMDFMTADNSYLVDYKMVDVHPNDYPPFEKGYVWADPDVGQATELMRYVYRERGRAREMGLKAGREIRSLLDVKSEGRRVRGRLADIYAGLGSVTNPPPTNASI
jgi:glycosyltransferase involved in cell wall biosynthesis